MLKVIKYGFRPIINDRVRGQNDMKGKKLFDSGHVLNVMEIENTKDDTVVTGKVVAQTRVSVLYNVKITLDSNRNILNAECSCKAGLSGKCKHICALLHYVNSPESASSKTSQLQEWGKPSHRQLLGYDKGATMASLFPPKPLCAKASQLKPCPISSDIVGKSLAHTPLSTMLRFEEKNQAEIIAAESLVEIAKLTEKKATEDEARKVTREIFMLQLDNAIFSSQISISSDKHLEFFNERVCCDIDTALDISVRTIDQSKICEWFEERKLRITASIGHRVKGARFDVDKVTTNLLSGKKFSTPATSYGTRNEEVALRNYQKLLNPGCKVVKVGLIISLKQPWLSCSPDGIVVYGKNIWEKRLVEIKCPYNCRNTPIYDQELSKINVKFLKMDENGLRLNENHSIFTQVQLQMYVTNIALCDLFIYSPKGCALVQVKRDNVFLARVIPRIEQFYFTHYLQRLCC